MKSLVTSVIVPALVCGLLTGCGIENKKEEEMPVLTIRWQRLLDEAGETCPRCGATEAEIDKAFDRLREALAALGIEVRLEKSVLDMRAFQENPSESNSISIAGRPLEEWLSAQVDQSLCCGPCGDTECRAIVVGGKTYEAIPAGLIERAGLMAASMLVGDTPSSCGGSQESPNSNPCCPGDTSEQNHDSGGCCPE
jgi:hypothetical protein